MRFSRLVTAAALVAVAVFAPVPVGHADPVAGVDGFVPAPTPSTDACPYQVSPAPAVDSSETVAPGETTPTPIPVPTPAVGGEKLAGCGLIADPAAGPVPEFLTSAGWLIADLDSGAVIAAKDPHGRYRPASTIKTLLAVTVLNKLNLDDVVVGTENDWAVEGDSCGIGPGGRYTVEQLLTGLLMVSGNDCANALARQLGGYQEALDAMNATAAALGAKDTRAASPSGLDAAGMSTSPYDLALIFREAMTHDEFRRIISLTTFEFPGYPPIKDVPGDKPHPAYTMGTSNSLLRDGYPGMLGGKTGFTDDARKTFVGVVERDGRKVLIVQMYGLNVAGDSYFAQAERMFDYGFAAPADTSVGTLEIEHDESHPALAGPGDEHSGAGRDDSSALGTWALVAIVVVIGGGVIAFWTTRRRRS